MAAIGHPVVGDPTYSRMTMARSNVLGEGTRKVIQDFHRQALHAYLLGFKHPRDHAPVRWEAEIPRDMKELLQVLEGN
jgi:23S rRNA pseudouridine1911/1915/1917 synthase